MKTYTFLLCIFLLFPYWLSAQSTKIQQLKDEVLGTSGKVYIEKMLNLSDGYLEENSPDLALKAIKPAITMAEEINDNILIAKGLNREGKALKQKGSLSKAKKRLEKSQKLLSKLDQKALQFDNVYTLLQIAQLRNKSKDITSAENQIAILKNSLKLSSKDIQDLKKIGIYESIFPNAIAMEEISEKNEKLEKAVENLEEAKVELKEKSDDLVDRQVQLNNIVVQKQKEIVQMTESQAKTELLVVQQKRMMDSLDFEMEIDSLVLAISDKELDQAKRNLQEQETIAALKQSQRNFSLALAGMGIIVAFGMFLRFLGAKNHAKVLEEKNKIIKDEKERSEELLLNILPKAIAKELKEEGEAKARHYEKVTVLFADFKNFSEISKQMTPEVLISELDYCFKNFDFITSNLQLEKIKTIGDCYMCAGGLPTPNDDHPTRVIQAALEMQNFLEQLKQEKIKKGIPYFEARIGIHTGPIIAGVVGLKKFAYDIWGDTVNVASRMETGSEPGRVNISGSTYELVKKEFKMEYRGKVPAKNMGEVDMYFVEG